MVTKASSETSETSEISEKSAITENSVSSGSVKRRASEAGESETEETEETEETTKKSRIEPRITPRIQFGASAGFGISSTTNSATSAEPRKPRFGAGTTFGSAFGSAFGSVPKPETSWLHKDDKTEVSTPQTTENPQIQSTKSTRDLYVQIETPLHKSEIPITGEEEEETIFTCSAKLFAFPLTNSETEPQKDKTWKERGIGELHINKLRNHNNKSYKHRLIMRNRIVGRVILNLPIVAGTSASVSSANDRVVHVTGVEDGNLWQFAIKTGNSESAGQICKIVAEFAEEAKNLKSDEAENAEKGNPEVAEVPKEEGNAERGKKNNVAETTKSEISNFDPNFNPQTEKRHVFGATTPFGALKNQPISAGICWGEKKTETIAEAKPEKKSETMQSSVPKFGSNCRFGAGLPFSGAATSISGNSWLKAEPPKLPNPEPQPHNVKDLYVQIAAPLQERQTATGEEAETMLFKCTARLFAVNLGNLAEGWKERGIGELHVNERSEAEAEAEGNHKRGRIVMRARQTLKVILNMPLVAGMRVDLKEKSKIVLVTGLEDGVPVQLSLRVGSHSVAEELKRNIDKFVANVAEKAEKGNKSGESGDDSGDNGDDSGNNGDNAGDNGDDSGNKDESGDNDGNNAESGNNSDNSGDDKPDSGNNAADSGDNAGINSNNHKQNSDNGTNSNYASSSDPSERRKRGIYSFRAADLPFQRESIRPFGTTESENSTEDIIVTMTVEEAPGSSSESEAESDCSIREYKPVEEVSEFSSNSESGTESPIVAYEVEESNCGNPAPHHVAQPPETVVLEANFGDEEEIYESPELSAERRTARKREKQREKDRIRKVWRNASGSTTPAAWLFADDEEEFALYGGVSEPPRRFSPVACRARRFGKFGKFGKAGKAGVFRLPRLPRTYNSVPYM